MALTCTLAALLAPAAAWAHAPMCDEHAQTIDAPVPIYPSKGGQIAAVADCNDRFSPGVGSAPERDPGRPLLTAEAIDRGLAAAAPVPPCTKSARLSLASTELGRARAGSSSDVFRPPRA